MRDVVIYQYMHMVFYSAYFINEVSHIAEYYRHIFVNPLLCYGMQNAFAIFNCKDNMQYNFGICICHNCKDKQKILFDAPLRGALLFGCSLPYAAAADARLA